MFSDFVKERVYPLGDIPQTALATLALAFAF